MKKKVILVEHPKAESLFPINIAYFEENGECLNLHS